MIAFAVELPQFVSKVVQHLPHGLLAPLEHGLIEDVLVVRRDEPHVCVQVAGDVATGTDGGN